MRAKEISNLLANKAGDVVRHLLPNGKRVGNEWCVGSIHGEAGKSLKVCLVGEKVGLWSDFAVGGTTSGDLLDLWRQIRATNLAEAILEAKVWLGIGSPQFMPSRRLNFVKPKIKNHTQWLIKILL